LKRCALLGVLGALALPSAAFAAPGPPLVRGCDNAAAHAAAPGKAAVLLHCPEAPPPA